MFAAACAVMLLMLVSCGYSQEDLDAARQEGYDTGYSEGYATIEELDEAVLNRLISRILIGEVKKVDGQKVQEVRIVYNFVGEIPEIAA